MTSIRLMGAVVIGMLCSSAAYANPNDPNEIGSIKKATESQEYEQLKETYRACVLGKVKDYLSVASLSDVIEHAPLACKRELFSVRQFLLSGAFKVDVINQLTQSVAEGVQIDLVNLAYEESIKARRGR